MSWRLEHNRTAEQVVVDSRKGHSVDFTLWKTLLVSSKWEDCRPLVEDSQESIGDESLCREIFEEYSAQLIEEAKESERKRKEERPKRHVSTVTRPHLGLRHGTIDDLAHLASAPTLVTIVLWNMIYICWLCNGATEEAHTKLDGKICIFCPPTGCRTSSGADLSHRSPPPSSDVDAAFVSVSDINVAFVSVSDVNAAFLSISNVEAAFVCSNKLQFVYVTCIDVANPLPLVLGLNPLPCYRPYVGNPTLLLQLPFPMQHHPFTLSSSKSKTLSDCNSLTSKNA
ncbi:hypothetical protein Fmac_027373 [Flemingia macrophylla]|uniref:DUF936 domain-containing protein n=1 Tax=Flemingia macrophylla TaxID=520843 RepID=A0ABD1LHI0_9FABA